MTETRKRIPAEHKERERAAKGDTTFGTTLARRVSRERLNNDDICSTLRKGKWTTEEEDYANKIISLFNRGLLPIPAGTTLRTYLSETLHWYVMHTGDLFRLY